MVSALVLNGSAGGVGLVAHAGCLTLAAAAWRNRTGRLVSIIDLKRRSSERCGFSKHLCNAAQGAAAAAASGVVHPCQAKKQFYHRTRATGTGDTVAGLRFCVID